MSKIILRFAFPAFAILAVILALAPHRAYADTIDATITTTSGTITGSYQFSDDASDSDTIGTWSFNLSALGLSNISSTDVGAAASVTQESCSGNPCDLVAFFSVKNDFTNLSFVVSEPSDLSIVPGLTDDFVDWDVAILTGEADITSVVLTDVPSTTPEPSSLLLLGCGLLGLLAMATFGGRIRLFA